MENEVKNFISSYNVSDLNAIKKKLIKIKKNIDDVKQQKIELSKVLKTERNAIAFDFYNSVKDTVQKAKVMQDINDSSYHLLLDSWPEELILPEFETIKGDSFKHNDNVLVYIVPFKNNIKTIGKIVCSRTHPSFLEKLIEYYVPEIKNGEIKIINTVREPGNRAKVSLKCNKEETNTFGAIIGRKLSRINKIRHEINNEQIDLIKFSSDPLEYVKNSLSPALIKSVKHLGGAKYRAFVSDYQLSLAIGPNAQNVRLAVRLTGLKIDIKTE